MKEISDFSTSVMWRNLKLIHVWTNFSFLHMFHVQNFEISPNDRFFLHGPGPWACDKYEVCTLIHWQLFSTPALMLVIYTYNTSVYHVCHEKVTSLPSWVIACCLACGGDENCIYYVGDTLVFKQLKHNIYGDIRNMWKFMKITSDFRLTIGGNIRNM